MASTACYAADADFVKVPPMPRAAAALLLSLLGPLAALGPRGLPVWLLLLAVVSAWGLIGERRRPVPPADLPATLAGIAFVVWAAVTAAWSPSARAALTALEIAYVGAGAFLIWSWLAGMDAAGRRRLTRIAAASIAAGMTVYALEVAFDYPMNRLWNGDRPAEWFAGSNVPKRGAALLALLAWPLAAFAAAEVPPRLQRWAEAAVAALCVALATLLASRSALTAALIGGAAYAAALAGQALRLRRLLQIAVAAAFIGAIPIGLTLAAATADWPADGWARSALHRFEIWGHAANRALETPLTGQGIDASRSLPIKHEVSRFAPLTNSAMPLHPHNAFLHVWLELGLIGAALAGFVAWRLLGRATAAATLGWSACALALTSSAYGVWQAWWMSGIVVAGLLVALASRDQASDAQKTP